MTTAWASDVSIYLGTHFLIFCMHSFLSSINRIKELYKNLLTIDQTYIKGSGYPPRRPGQSYDEYFKDLVVIGNMENIPRVMWYILTYILMSLHT